MTIVHNNRKMIEIWTHTHTGLTLQSINGHVIFISIVRQFAAIAALVWSYQTNGKSKHRAHIQQKQNSHNEWFGLWFSLIYWCWCWFILCIYGEINADMRRYRCAIALHDKTLRHCHVFVSVWNVTHFHSDWLSDSFVIRRNLSISNYASYIYIFFMSHCVFISVYWPSNADNKCWSQVFIFCMIGGTEGIDNLLLWWWIIFIASATLSFDFMIKTWQQLNLVYHRKSENLRALPGEK